MVYKHWLKLAPFFLLACAHLTGASWTPPATIPPTPTNINVSDNVFGVYNSATQQMFASWADPYDGLGYFSTYTTLTGWANPVPVDNFNRLFGDPYLTFVGSGANAGNIFLTSINASDLPVSYIFDSNTMSWGPQVVISNTLTVQSFVTSVYRPTTDTVFAAWNNGGAPQFAYYNAGVWTVESMPPTSPVLNNIFMAYDSSIDTVFAAWVLRNNPHNPVYWTYTGSGPWMGPFSIPGAGIADDIDVVYNEMLQSVVATWVDRPTNFPTYSMFQNGSWSPNPPQTIATIPTRNVSTAYDSDTGQVFAAWTHFGIEYSILDPVSLTWSPEGFIEPSGYVVGGVTLAYAGGTGSMFAFWGGGPYPNDFPTWSLYFQPVVPAPISNLTGKLLVNDFGTESELFARLHWSPSPSTNVEGYKIYDNGVLIAIVNASATSYAAHNMPKGVNLITVTAFNSHGESIPVSIYFR